MSTQTFGNMRKLRLSAMADALQHQLDAPGTYEDLAFTERLDFLLDHELQCRRQRSQQRLIKRAGFRLNATVQQLEYRSERNLNRQQIAQLAHCGWIEKAQNLLLTGPCGSGKTYLACALGRAACMLEMEVRYIRLPLLLAQFDRARVSADYERFIQRMGRIPLVIIDNWGLQPLTATDRLDLVELMDQRYGRTSTCVISQLPSTSWYGCVGDSTLADAILDRLVHNAHRIEFKGESMRKRLNADLSESATEQ